MKAVRDVIRSFCEYNEIRYYKDKRKNGHRIVFKGMTKEEATKVLKSLPDWELYENTRGSGRFPVIRKFGIQTGVK